MNDTTDLVKRLLRTFDAVFARGDLDEARRVAARLHAEAKDSVEDEVVRARLSAADGNADDAVRALESLVERKPLAALAHAYLGALLVALGDVERAERHLRHAHTEGVHVPAMDHALGMLALEEGRIVDAERALTSAAKRMPESSTTQHYLGQALAMQGKLAPAEEAFVRAIEVEPRLVAAVIDLVLVRLQLGKPHDALAAVVDALAVCPDEAELYRLKTHTAIQLGDQALAEETLRALPETEKSAEDETNLAMLLLGRHAFAEAAELASRACARDRSFWWPEYVHGLALEGQSARKSVVVEAYERAIAKGDPKGEAGTRLGYLLLTGDDPDPEAAVRVLEAALERSGYAPGTALNLALASWRSGESERARSLASDVAESATAAESDKKQARELLSKLAN
jgi:tetratricopeptide (TPR) repeat protein